MNNQSFRFRLLQLTLLPIAIAIVVLTSFSIAFFSHQMDLAITEKGKSVSLQIAQLLAPVLAKEESAEIRRNAVVAMLPAALEESSIRAISVLDAQGEPMVHVGPRFLAAMEDATDSAAISTAQASPLLANVSATGIGSVSTADSTVILRTISNRSTQQLSTQQLSTQHLSTQNPSTENQSTENPSTENQSAQSILGFVQVEVAHDAFTLKKYRMAFLTLLIALLALISGLAIIYVWGRRIYVPIQQLTQAVDQLAQGNFDLKLDIPPGWALGNFAKKLMLATDRVREQQAELHSNMEQATDDLRESLDTVEMQNVQLNLARKEALQASRAKTEFLANTSHEIRTPINGILGFTGLLLKTRISAQQREYLQTIQKSSQGLLAIINDILDVAKLETGQLTLDHAPFNLRAVVEETLQALAPMAAAKKLQLVPLLATDTPLSLMGDALRLKQVLSNLINNAIKFSGTGSILVRVAPVVIGNNQVELNFRVEDQGSGIDEEQLRHLFSPFMQADSSHSRSKGGAGLGLSVAKGLVEKMQGQIQVETTVGKGSVFSFTAQFAFAKHSTEPVDNAALAGKRLLLCEPNTHVIEQLQSYFDRWQLSYYVVSAPEKIQQQLQTQSANNPIDCVLLDAATQPDVRTWAKQNPLVRDIQQRAQTKLVLLAQSGSDLDYADDDESHQPTIIHKPLSYDVVYDTLAALLLAPGAGSLQSSTIKTQPTRILAVDDNPANLQLIGELLKDLGASVTLAKDGAEAIDKFQQDSFDLVFMDIQMPVIDGLEATRCMRQLETTRRTPVVALTAHAMTDQKAELLLAGLDDYLSKPVTEAQLRHVIQRWTQMVTQPRADKELIIGSVAPDTAGAPVDIQLCLQLSNNKPELARDMLTLLLQNLAKDAQQITEFYKAGNYAELETVVHKLRGGASYCGVPQLKLTTSKLDELLRAGKTEQIHHPLTMVLDATAKLMEWGDEYDIDALFGLDTVE